MHCKKLFISVVILITSFLLIVSCGSTQKPEKGNADINAPVVSGDGAPTKLSGGVQNRTLGYKIDPAVMADMENGSAASIKRAVSKLKKSPSEYTENEKILITIAKNIMDIVWPSVISDIQVLEVSEENPYIGAIASAKKGVFDSSTGNVDFLSTILPALVAVTSNPNEQVLAKCEKCIIEARKFNNNSMFANYLAGVVYEKQGKYAEAQQYYKLAYDEASTETELSLAYSRMLSKMGDQEMASHVISSISSNNLNDINVLKQNAYIAFEKNELDTAEDYVTRVLQQNPNDLDFILLRTKIFIKRNDYIHAVSLLDMYSRQNDTNLDYLVLRASVQMDWSKNTTTAAETVEKALKLYPENEDALMLAAKLSSLTDAPVSGKYADDFARIVLEKNPQNIQALSYALEGYIMKESWKQAYEISSQLVNMPVADPDSVYRHVKVCINLGKKSEAYEVASKAYNADKKNETLIQSYVYAYSQVNGRDASINLINSFMDNASSKMKSFLYFRRSYLQRSEETQLADLRSSLTANPRNDEALFRLYEIYYSKKDYRKAQYYLKQVVAIRPNDAIVKKLNDSLTQLIK